MSKLYDDVKKQEVQIDDLQKTVTNHMKRTLTTKWEEYESSIAERGALFRHLIAQARVIEARGIHYGCSNDKELSRLMEIEEKLTSYGYGNSILPCISSIASQLESLKNDLTHDPNRYSMIAL